MGSILGAGGPRSASAALRAARLLGTLATLTLATSVGQVSGGGRHGCRSRSRRLEGVQRLKELRVGTLRCCFHLY
jgi:hypothetical protein